MNVVKHIICELTGYRPGTVDVSQGDRGSRAVSCRLMESGAPWMIPEGATARVAYTLPDGTEGLYDRRPDGSPMWEIAGNIVTVELADQLMAQAGMVQMSILIIGPEGGQLATWPIRVMVAANKAARLTVPEAMPPYGAGFAGKIFFGGEDGTITPLGIGDGVEIVRQEDGTFVLVASGGGGGAGSWGELEGKPVYMQGEQEKFDPAWLPDGGFGWAETGEATVEWDGSTEGLDVVAVGGDYTLVRVSGLLPSFEAMAGRTVEMADGSSFEITAETAAQSGPVWVVYGPVGDDLLPVLYGVGVTEVDGITLPGTGLYAVLYPDQLYRFARMTVAYEMVHRLDAKYLPEEAVREYTIDLDYGKTEVTSSDKNVLVGRIPNDLSAADINNAYASGQRLVVRLKIGDDGVVYMRLVGCGIRNWSFEVDMGSQYTADRIQKLYLELYQSEALSDAMTARVAYVNTVLGGDTEQVQADLAQNDPTQPDFVKGRTHWEENNQTVIEWDGNTEGRDTFPDSPNSAFYCISGNVPTVDEVVGGSVVYVYPDGILNIEITDAMCHQEDGVVAVGEDVAFIYIVGADAASAAGFAPGIYAIAGYEDAVGIGAPAAYVSAFSYGSTVVHPLDEKWIPDSIARVSQLPQPGDVVSPTATVEQTDTGATISITDKNGTTTAVIANGKDGKTPVKGEDYWTNADRTAMVDDVLEALPVWTGGAY